MIPPGMRERCAAQSRQLQDTITRRLSLLEGRPFQEDSWSRPGGGGGRTRVILDGELFEKAGVNFSEVHGQLSPEMARKLGEDSPQPRQESPSIEDKPGDLQFYATGLSLVLHPRSPRIPTVHANFRYLEKGDSWWFGGGADLTPYRLYTEDAAHFHRVWRSVCERHDAAHYPRFKKWCDEYFYLPHRKETRGVGGIFFDYLSGDAERRFALWRDLGEAFLEAYVPILERRRSEAYSDAEREWQLHRRGRYVEFNLVYDRGTVFGLKTSGRIESILMSLPPLVRWGYHAGPTDEVDEGLSGPEAELMAVLRSPRDWT